MGGYDTVLHIGPHHAAGIFSVSIRFFFRHKSTLDRLLAGHCDAKSGIISVCLVCVSAFQAFLFFIFKPAPIALFMFCANSHVNNNFKSEQ